MKVMQKMLLVFVITAGSALAASAQIYVTIRPSRPVYVRPAPPSPRHVWIEEDWNGVGDRYEWHGGYWAEPPTPGYYYRPGYWRHTDRGHVWNSGRWDAHPYRSQERHGNEGHGHENHGHGNEGHENQGHGNQGRGNQGHEHHGGNPHNKR